MTTISIQSNKLLFVFSALITLLLSACSTSPTPSGESQLPLDDQGRPYYPCEGDLCFKGVDHEEYQDVLSDLREAVSDKSDEVKESMEEYIRGLADSYGSCRYYHGSSGIIER